MKKVVLSLVALVSLASADQLTNLQIEGMTCPSCISDIKGSLSSVKGVKDSTVYLKDGKAQVKSTAEAKPEAMCDAVKKIGYGCKVVK